jgi:succinate dehydrogenase/fumarate reductase cytochrome b subunit
LRETLALAAHFLTALVAALVQHGHFGLRLFLARLDVAFKLRHFSWLLEG